MKLFQLPEIISHTAPIADLGKVDPSQIDTLARHRPKKRYSEGNVTIRGP